MPCLADELLLFAFDDAGRSHAGSTDIGCALAGALLVELALAGRIVAKDGVLEVRDSTPTGEEGADRALEQIADESKPREPEWWVDKLRSGVRERVLDRLVERGWLQCKRRKVLGLVRVSRYIAEPNVKAALCERLADAVARGAQPDARSAALASLLDAAGLARKTFPGIPDLDVRLKQLADGDWASDAVRNAIASVQAAVIVASTVAATTAATVGG